MTGAEPPGRLLGVALGASPADLLAVGGDVVNVYTGEVVRWDVAVANGRIAAVGPDLASLAGPATERLDVRGKVLVPGFLALRLTTRGLLSVKSREHLPALL